MEPKTLTVTVKLDEKQLRALLPRCETCKHWHREPWRNGMGWHSIGTCDALQLAGGRHLVQLPFPAHDMPVTNLDFGCNLHESEAANG